MNADRILQTIFRMVTRRLIGRGVNAGIDKAMGPKEPQEQLTPEERKQRRKMRQQTRQAKQAMRATRKIRRF
ncbi:hypothetical protein [Primorskyibacter flagellatus]|uniref:hypothetical protein n=1 Tax=Primorskyibacter flagellatus TaxID=1387277 RepID=UPI003A8F978A